MSGLIIIPIYIIYVIVGFIVIKVILKIFNKKLYSIVVLAIVIIFPFWDIFVANGILKIASYYIKPTIYEMPQRDKDGKIESVGSSLTTSTINIDRLRDKKELEKFRTLLQKDKISDFIEFRLHNDKLAKIYLNTDAKKGYEVIEKPQERYISIYNRDEPNDIWLLGFKISRSQVEIHDTKKNKIIAIAPTFGVWTPWIMNVIRGGVFMLISGGGGAPMVKTKAIVTKWDLNEELFNDIKYISKGAFR